MAEDEERELTEEEQAEADRKAKRKQRIMLIALALVLVLLSVGVTLGLLHFLSEDEAESTEGEPVVEEAPPEPASQEAIYYPLNEKLVVNYNVRGRQRFLQVEVSLMFRDNAVAAALEKHMPRIRNDLIMLMSGQEFEDLQTPEGRELLRQDALRSIQAILQEEIGQPGIEQVLFTSFVMQ
ncbi:flagellar basal body-associated FliL family protein [Marinimicrobium agarilyticum]|uniref:flagellar basal body-associated FliL family protein n=1 Tax=Marinimicrobium agarilyticum TaxID=306546 RepID=UPI00040BCCA4|nr:flagellar basal body-associated FliL family protein [Marinimicrobium agarilyticum]